MTRILAIAALLLSLPVGASAASIDGVIPFTGDAVFTQICTRGSNTEACDRGRAEIRAGNAASDGDWEFGFVQNRATLVEGDFAWPDPQQQVGFEVTFNLLTGAANMTLGSEEIDTTNIQIGMGNSLFIRARGEGTGTTTLSSLALGGKALTAAPLVASGGSAGAAYLAIDLATFLADVDPAEYLQGDGLKLSGFIEFQPDSPEDFRGSRFAAQFKIVEIAPVPLPASALLLLGAVGALGAIRRRKAAA